MPFKMLICDDIKYMCQYFKTIFDGLDNFEVVATASTKKEIMSAVSEKKPDVVLLDIQMDTAQTGLDIIPYIKSNAPEAKIIMLTVNEQNSMIYRAIELGADNYVLKEDSLKLLHDTMVNVYNSQNVISGDVAHTLVKKSRETEVRQRSLLQMLEIMSRLSVSEYEVLKLIYAGKSYREIAKERFVEVATIKVQASRILKKFNEKSMVVLIAQIKNLKLFDLFKDVRG